MDRIPFGISRLDDMIGGGAPAGSVVLLAGESGAGAREFLYTSGIVNGLAAESSELFDLHYGDLAASAVEPEGVHYVSMTAGEREVRQEMAFVMERELVEAGAEAIRFADLSPEYFQLSPVPREWYAEEARSIQTLTDSRDHGTPLDALGDYLDAHAAGNLVLLDSVTDLLALVQGQDAPVYGWSDVTLLLKGLTKASARWNGLVLLLVNADTLTDQQLGTLMDACDGTMLFEWAAGGSERARTLVVRQFRGVLSRLEEEDIVRFETDVGDGGFDISDVRKIR